MKSIFKGYSLTSNDNCDNETQALHVNKYCNHKKVFSNFMLLKSKSFLKQA